MSEIDEKNPKHCAKKSFSIKKLIKKKLFCKFFTFFLSTLSLIFLVWLILHPSKPRFSLQQAEIYQLNLSNVPDVVSSFDVTILSKNPNQKVGIYYDVLQVYADYKGQQITLHTSLPPFYQGHEESSLLSALLVRNGLPVSPSFPYQLGRDQITEKLMLDFKVNGRLRWKVGTWVSGRYSFRVNCIAVIPFGPSSSSSSSFASAPLSAMLGTECSTTL